MTGTDEPAWRERYLSLGWNNALTIAFAVPIALWVIVTLSTSSLSDRAAFIGMVLLGAVY